MKWYIAKIIFQIRINQGEHHSQFDESVRLIEAASLPDAFNKARDIGRMEETSFLNQDAQDVHWKFIDVYDVHPIGDLRHGSEIYSTTEVHERSHEFVHLVKHKALMFQKDQIILS